MIIDFHTHCFPEKIAERAIASLSHAAGGLVPHTNGTPESLIKLMDEVGVSKSVVLGIATNEKQMQNVNNFAKELSSDRLIGFGSVHPDSENVFEELERIKSLGLKGVKFHPEYQSFYVDDIKMKQIYEKIASLGLITVFHAGLDLGYAPPYHCTPDRMARAIDWFDGSPVIAAHFGGYGFTEEVIDTLCGLPIYMDTAFAYASIPRESAAEIIRKHGADKILFASDCPWHSPALEIRFIESLDLSEEEKQLIYYKNAERLLGM